MTKSERQLAVHQAIANQRLEGCTVSPDVQQLMDDYVAGRITAKQAAELVYAKYGVL